MLEQRSPNGECWEFLNSITNEERSQLIYFAQRRLSHFALRIDRDEELYQQALCSIVQGIHRQESDDSTQEGRKPRPVDVQSRPNFLNYVRGAINSIAEGWARPNQRNGYRAMHYPLDVVQEFIAAPKDTSVDFRELSTELFSALRKQAPAKLLPTIDAWEKAPDGRIPRVTNRKHVFAVRKLSQKIARELGYAPRKPATKPPSVAIASEASPSAEPATST